MKFIKLYLFKLSRWWKYLFFIGIFFIFGNNVFAMTEDFDSYSDGDQINSKPYWALSNATELVSNTYASSSPNSLRQAGNVSIYYNINEEFDVIYFSFRNRHDTNSAKVYNVYGFDNVICGSSCYFIDNIFDFGLKQSANKIYFSASSTEHTLLSSPVVDTWYYAKVEYDKTNHLVKGTLLNNGVDSGWLPIKSTLNGSALQKILILGNIYSGNYFYTDDINLNVTNLVDKVEFINPLDAGFYNLVDGYSSPYYFNWHVSFNLGTSTVANYPSDRPLVTISFEKVGSYNPTIFEMTDFVLLDNEYYGSDTWTLIDENISNYPTELGEYNAIATLWDVYTSNGEKVYSHILDDQEINFTIQSATTTTPTAWCSNLCADIATSTGLLSEIGNGVNCALRSAVCYLFYPHQYNINQFVTQYENFKQVFPFNTFFDIASTTENAFASSTMSSNTTFGLPNIRKTGTTTEYYIQPLLSSSTMGSFIGQSNATLFRTTISYLIYAITAGGIFLILW